MDTPDTALMVIDAIPVPEAKTEVWKRKKGQALSSAELRLMLLLHQEGKSQQEIAHRLQCHQSCISHNLKEWADTKVEAKAVIGRSARKLAEKLVTTSDDTTILEILDRADILEKKRNVDEGAPRVAVLVGISLPKESK
jgi:transposase